jgi:hypothetical protein
MISTDITLLMESACVLIAILYPLLCVVYRFSNPAKDMNKMKSFQRSLPILFLFLAIKLVGVCSAFTVVNTWHLQTSFVDRVLINKTWSLTYTRCFTLVDTAVLLKSDKHSKLNLCFIILIRHHMEVIGQSFMP